MAESVKSQIKRGLVAIRDSLNEVEIELKSGDEDSAASLLLVMRETLGKVYELAEKIAN
jgi:hypothetical protein